MSERRLNVLLYLNGKFVCRETVPETTDAIDIFVDCLLAKRFAQDENSLYYPIDYVRFFKTNLQRFDLTDDRFVVRGCRVYWKTNE